jgi:ATP-dependent protease ClpP protease subunit
MTDKLKDNLTNFHDNGIYIPRRTVSLFGGIDMDRFKTVFKNLHALDISSGDINLIINSEGGDVVQGKGIYQAIKGCSNHVRGIVYGEASSAASFILQACDKRVMTTDSYLLLHIGQEELSENHPRNIDRLHEFYRELETWLESVYLKKIKEKKKRFTRNQIKSMLQFDKYIYPAEALELGLIDEIKDSL